MIEPDGMMDRVRHAWRTSTNWPVRIGWGIACFAGTVSFLVISLIITFAITATMGITDGWFLLLPAFAWMFAVAPLGALGILAALTGIGSDDRRLVAYTALLSLMAIVVPPVVFFLIGVLLRIFA